jgi:hypothetical protein
MVFEARPTITVEKANLFAAALLPLTRLPKSESVFTWRADFDNPASGAAPTEASATFRLKMERPNVAETPPKFIDCVHSSWPTITRIA